MVQHHERDGSAQLFRLPTESTSPRGQRYRRVDKRSRSFRTSCSTLRVTKGTSFNQGYAGIISMPPPGRCSPAIFRDRPLPSMIPHWATSNRCRKNAISGQHHSRKPNQPGCTKSNSIRSQRQPSRNPKNNISPSQKGPLYNLHKIDTKIDYQATSKLRISGRYGYQPYNNIQNPLFGPFLGACQRLDWHSIQPNGAGNYSSTAPLSQFPVRRHTCSVQHLVADFTFGATQAHQLLFPTDTNVKVGADMLGIPGTNVGALPLAGGMPHFDIGGYPSSRYEPTFGYSYPPLQYKDPVFEYAGNVTKIMGSHNIRFGEDIIRVHHESH